MDAAGPVDAQNAPTGPWITADGSPRAPTAIIRYVKRRSKNVRQSQGGQISVSQGGQISLTNAQAVECELKRTVFFFTHQVSPSVVRLLASEPCKLRTRRLIRWVRYHGEIGNPGLVDGERLSTRPIGRITEDDLEVVFAQLSTLAGSTWNKYRDAVRLMQRWGLKKGYLLRPWLHEDNETITHREVARRERRLEPDVLDDDDKLKNPGEERRLLEKASPWLYRLVVAALETGCRRGELLSLRWADVSFSRGLLTVRAENAKSRKSRRVPISPRLWAVLKVLGNDPAGNPHLPSAFVFGDGVGRQIKDPKKAWLACCKATGITNLHFHDLRHEAGSRMLEAGWPLHHVQAVLGHADAKTTSTYLNATVQHLLDSMRRFGVQPLHDVAQSENLEPPLPGNTPLEPSHKPLVN